MILNLSCYIRINTSKECISESFLYVIYKSIIAENTPSYLYHSKIKTGGSFNKDI